MPLSADGRGFRATPIKEYGNHREAVLVCASVEDIRVSDPQLYLAVVEYCFTRYPHLRGEVGLLLGRSRDPAMTKSLLEVLERVCADEPRAAMAAYLNAINPIYELTEEFQGRWEGEPWRRQCLEVLAAHPLIVPSPWSQVDEVRQLYQVSLVKLRGRVPTCIDQFLVVA